MKRSRIAYLIAGGLMVGAILVLILFPGKLTAVSPDYWDAKTSILLGLPPFPPSAQHPLGTDLYGRDIWSRVVYGARWSMLFAVLIMAGRLLLALPAALLATFGHRRISWFIDRLYVMTSAIPPLLIYILVLSAPQLRLIGLWPSVTVTIALLTLIEWPRVAVVLKSRLDSLRAEPFMEGAVAVGNTRWQLFKNHLFPHLWPVLLQLISAEIARGLLVIAQLGIFSILVGGGVMNIIDNGHGGDKYVVTTGVAEWGTLLSDGRAYILSQPWIPFAPAFAFLVGVVGFNLLSQGLETVAISVQQIKEATTGRLSARWRWAWLAVGAAAVLGYYQGLPWGRAEGIQALAARQAAALTSRDLPAFLTTLSRADLATHADFHRWAAQVTAGDFEVVGIAASNIALHGNEADATWTMDVGYRSQPPSEQVEQVHLVRRWGRWYVAGQGYHDVRGFQTDVSAVYDPVDPTVKSIPLRWNVQFLVTAADHAYTAVAGLFPHQAGAPRPRLTLYPTDEAFRQAVGSGLPASATIFWQPGEPIRVSPDFLKGGQRWDVERSLALELMKFLTVTRLHQTTVDPLALGAWELAREPERDTYRLEIDQLTGQPLLSLPDLWRTRLDELTQDRQFVYVTESALLVEYVKGKLPPGTAPDQAAASGGTVALPGVGALDLPALAARLSTTPAALTTDFDEYVRQRVASESLLAIPGARSRVPAGLADAIAGRASSATAGDTAGVMARVAPGVQKAEADWLKEAQQAGLQTYEASFIDFQQQGATADVKVLEHLTFRNGTSVAGVVDQPWYQQNGTWVTSAVGSPLMAALP